MKYYIFGISFLLFIPLIWWILLASRFESLFKQNKIWQIRIAYIVTTIIISGMLAFVISEFVSIFSNI